MSQAIIAFIIVACCIMHNYWNLIVIKIITFFSKYLVDSINRICSHPEDLHNWTLVRLFFAYLYRPKFGSRGLRLHTCVCLSSCCPGTVALGWVSKPPEVCCRWTVQGNIWSPKQSWGRSQSSKSSLIIYIIHNALPLSLHLLSSSPQIQLPLRLIGKVAISIQLRLWYRRGMQLIWIISLPHVVNNRLTGGRIQRVGCSAHCLLPAVRSGWTLNIELSLTPSLSLSPS